MPGNSTSKIFSLVILALSFVGCGQNTIDLDFQLDLAPEVEALVLNGDITMRVFYTYNGIGTESSSGAQRVQVFPSAANPTTVPVQVNGRTVSSYNWAKASAAGYAYDGSITIPGVPVRKSGMEIAVEFLRLVNGEYFVVAYWIYPGPDDRVWTEAEMKAEAVASRTQRDDPAVAAAFTVNLGRTCGSYATRQTVSDPAASPTC